MQILETFVSCVLALLPCHRFVLCLSADWEVISCWADPKTSRERRAEGDVPSRGPRHSHRNQVSPQSRFTNWFVLDEVKILRLWCKIRFPDFLVCYLEKRNVTFNYVYNFCPEFVPNSLSATRRQPIKGAAGRPFSDTWQDSLRPRLTEHRYTSSSYTETRSVPRVSVVPRVSAVPLPAPRLAAPPSVQAKPRRRVPVWVQLLLLAAVTGFLLFVYQAMESNQTSPFGQLGRTAEVENNARKWTPSL